MTARPLQDPSVWSRNTSSGLYWLGCGFVQIQRQKTSCVPSTDGSVGASHTDRVQKPFGTNSCSSGGGQGHFPLFLSLKAPLWRIMDGRKSSVQGEKLMRARGQKWSPLSLKWRWPEQKTASEKLINFAALTTSRVSHVDLLCFHLPTKVFWN